VYDAERYGARLVASPRHADVVLVTGPVTRNMAEPLRRTVAALGEPRLVIAVGDCAVNCGEFADGYGVEGAACDVVPVDLTVPGCPPEPERIVAALRRVTGR
jgi:Ni,Fe-hydrogenase III small subunit